MNDWPVSVIPNPLDTDEWRPVEKAVARRLLGLPDDVPTILYGASGGWSEPGKGFDLLEASLRHLDVDRTDALLLVSGKGAPPATEVGGVKVRYTGFLHDAIALRIFYSAADVLAVPSRIESFGQVATEAHACGTPVVAFDNSGLSDVVTHERNGYLAHAFDVRDFARGLSLILARGEHAKEMGANARADAISRFSYPVVARAYLDVYTESLSDGRIESPR